MTTSNKINNTHIDTDTLIGTWLRGEHLEDLKHVTAEDLPAYKDVLAELKTGYTLLDCVRTFPGRAAELAELSTHRNDTLYKLALSDLLETQIKRHLQDWDLATIASKLEYARLTIEDTPEPEHDPSTQFLEELGRRQTEHPVAYPGLPTLTSWTGGIRRKALTTIAARPGVGKSSLGLQIAYGAALADQDVMYIPLEMTTTETVERLLNQLEYTDPDELRSGRITDQRRFQLGLEEIDTITRDHLKIYEGRGQLETIAALIHKEHPAIAIIDQLSQVRTRQSFKDLRSQYVYITRELKRIAMQENTAIILLAQLNRGAETDEPGLHNLKESGSLEEDSDNVILLHRLPEGQIDGTMSFDWDRSYPYVIILAKHRGGRTGRIQATFAADRTKFAEI